MNKIILICLWFGKIPDYFKYHYETAISNKNVNFLFITDQNIELYSSNYKIIKIDLQNLKDRIKCKLDIDYIYSNNRNICQLKCGLGDIFYEEIKDYDYWGYYDIDTLLGDFNSFVLPILNEYDIVSFGVKNVHDRISGPLTIIKNCEKNNKLYKIKFSDFVYKLYNYDVDSFDETEFNTIVTDEKLRIKILYDVCNFLMDKGYPVYDSLWSGGKLFINGNEKLIHHFIDKKNINFYNIGNSIITFHRKDLIEDFFWVTYFTENYEDVAKYALLESIYNFSNRKCIVYTINYNPDIIYQKNEQFIFRRLDIPTGEKYENGLHCSGYANILVSKPLVLSDVITFKPNDKFVYVDSDIYLTVTADNIVKYFENIENYPLINSHIHDRIYINDILPTKEWISPLDVLSEATEIPIIIFPRRKTNVMLFNCDCKWFFDEQMKLYDQYKNSRIGIFRCTDEDSANILLSKYDFRNSLPVIDMEESSVIDINKFKNYSYNSTQLSKFAILPHNTNEILVFHGFKNIKTIQKTNVDYLPTVIEHKRLSISYENKTLLIKKYSLFSDKKIQIPVHFNIKNINGDILYELNNQNIYGYWLFYISNCILVNGLYIIQIEDNFNNIIFNKIIKIE